MENRPPWDDAWRSVRNRCHLDDNCTTRRMLNLFSLQKYTRKMIS